MPGTQQSGITNNMTNLDLLITAVDGYGVKYNPTYDLITLVSLKNKQTITLASIELVEQLEPIWKGKVRERHIIFDPLEEYFTKVFNAVCSSPVTPEFIANVRTIIRKLHGQRATPKKNPPPTPAADEHTYISVSQKGFDNKVDFTNRLIQLLTTEPNYNPNEAELTVAALTTLHGKMKIANKAVIDAANPLDNARIARNNHFNNPDSGIVALSIKVKQYVKSIFFAKSPQFALIKGLKFRKIYK